MRWTSCEPSRPFEEAFWTSTRRLDCVKFADRERLGVDPLTAHRTTPTFSQDLNDVHTASPGALVV